MGFIFKKRVLEVDKRVFKFDNYQIETSDFLKTDKLNENSIISLKNKDENSYLVVIKEEGTNYKNDFNFFLKEKDKENKRLYHFLKKEESHNKIYNYYDLEKDGSKFLLLSYAFHDQNKFYEILGWTSTSKLDSIKDIMESLKYEKTNK